MIDARLAAPALTAWMAVILVWLGGWSQAESRTRTSILIAVVLCSAAVAVVLWSRSATSVGAALGILSGCLVALLQVTALWSGPVVQAAADARRVIVTGIVQSDPQPRAGPAWVRRPQAAFPLATSSIEVAGMRTDVAVPITVVCSCDRDDVAVGAVVRLSGRLTQAPDPVTAAVLRIDEGEPITTVMTPGPPDLAANAIRRDLRVALSGVDPGPASVVAGLSTGDVSLMPPLLADQMRATGMAHLTAVSGANVAIVLAWVIGLAASLRARVRARVALALASLVGFVILVRPEPSVMRAAAMGAVVVVAMLSGGRRAGPAVLAVAVLFLILLAPSLAVSWGFALSVTATLGILLAVSRAERWLPGRTPPLVAAALALTIAAQLATMPVLLLMGLGVSWVSIPANVLAGIAVAPVTVLGLMAALVAPVFMPAAVVLAQFAAVPASFIAGIASWASALPGAGLQVPTGPIGLVCCVVLALIALVLRHHWRRSFTLVLTAAVLLLLVDPPGARSWPPEGWVLVACDVGQGDALVVRGTGEAVMVVDTGPDDAALLTCLRDLGVSRIGILVLTHFHADHVGGLAAALTHDVDAIVVSPVFEPAETHATAQARLGDRRVEVAEPGMRLALPGIEATVLWPAERIDEGSVPNNASIVLEVEVNSLRLLLSGDVEREAQAALAALPPRPFDVVKVPHHGSANLDEGFIRWAQAPIAVVTVGRDNDYGHPAPGALEAWGASMIGRTDTDGAVAVVRRDGRLGLVRRG